MTDLWDTAVYDRFHQLVLVVEVKKLLGTTPQWAAGLRRNLLAHGDFPAAPYFLIACPDRFYLWTKEATAPGETEPDYSVDARPLLLPHLAGTDLALESISRSTFEMVVNSWIGRLVALGHEINNGSGPPGWLVESGLLDAVEGGQLALEVAA